MEVKQVDILPSENVTISSCSLSEKCVSPNLSYQGSISEDFQERTSCCENTCKCQKNSCEDQDEGGTCRPRADSLGDVYDILRGMQTQLGEVHERWHRDLVHLQKVEKENEALLERIQAQEKFISALNETVSCSATRERLLIQQCDILKERLLSLQRDRRLSSFVKRARGHRSQSDTIITNTFTSYAMAKSLKVEDKGCQVDLSELDLWGCQTTKDNTEIYMNGYDVFLDSVTGNCAKKRLSGTSDEHKTKLVRKSRCFSCIPCVLPCKQRTEF